VQLDQILRTLPSGRRWSSHELVAAVLREAITTGHLKANQPLPQDEIANQLRVSHIPVREALRQLQSEGLVHYQPNRGATVAALGPAEIAEIYEIRAILETAAIRQAVPKLSRPQLERARAILAQAKQARDAAAWGSLDVEFHQLIYGLDRRPQLGEMIAGLLRRVDRYWLTHGLMLKYRDEFEGEHDALLDALERRDVEAASRLLEEHLAGASRLLVAALAAHEAAGAVA